MYVLENNNLVKIVLKVYTWDLGCRERDSNPWPHGIPGISQSTAFYTL